MHRTIPTAAIEHDSHDLKRMLTERGRDLEREVHRKIRSARNGSSKERDVLDEGEAREVDVQTAIDFSLLQNQVETLNAIEMAVRRLGEGTYGICVECGNTIHDARLRALPFAVRCKGCEELREMSSTAESDPGIRSCFRIQSHAGVEGPRRSESGSRTWQ